jgi:hypothetical protein
MSTALGRLGAALHFQDGKSKDGEGPVELVSARLWRSQTSARHWTH